jgi:hypothetical protein
VNNTEKKEKKNSRPQPIDSYSNAEYIYIIEDQEVWFIDYIIGIAFKTPIDSKTKNKFGIGLQESGRLVIIWRVCLCIDLTIRTTIDKKSDCIIIIIISFELEMILLLLKGNKICHHCFIDNIKWYLNCTSKFGKTCLC